MKSSFKPVWPKEHGGWGLLFVPLVTGIFSIGTPGVAELIFVVMTLAFYLSRPPLLAVLKKRGREGLRSPVNDLPLYLFATALVAVSGFAILVIGFGYLLLPLIGGIAMLLLAVNLGLVLKKRTKDFVTEFLAAAGFSLGAPAGYYISSGRVDEPAFLLWAINILFLVHMIIYVRTRLSMFHSRVQPKGMLERLAASGYYFPFVLLFLVMIAVLIEIAHANWILPLALVPSFVHAVIGVLRMDARLVPNRLGFGQLAHCLVFSILLIALMRKATLFP